MSLYYAAVRQRGVGLVEVMVALLLLGIAVMGFAALQVRAVGSTQEALFRTQGMAVAQEMAERMRANTNVNSGVSLTDVYRAGSSGSVTATQCLAGVCTPDQMAKYDLASVKALAAATLPRGQLAVVPCPGAANSCILVSWNQSNPTVGTAQTDCISSAGTYILNADCMMMEIY